MAAPMAHLGRIWGASEPHPEVTRKVHKKSHGMSLHRHTMAQLSVGPLSQVGRLTNPCCFCYRQVRSVYQSPLWLMLQITQMEPAAQESPIGNSPLGNWPLGNWPLGSISSSDLKAAIG